MQSGEDRCPICWSSVQQPYTLNCSHAFCRRCIINEQGTWRVRVCPMCRETISEHDIIQAQNNDGTPRNDEETDNHDEHTDRMIQNEYLNEFRLVSIGGRMVFVELDLVQDLNDDMNDGDQFIDIIVNGRTIVSEIR